MGTAAKKEDLANLVESALQPDTLEFAGRLYESYCESVGGLAFNGDRLPSWEELKADPSKTKIVRAWTAVVLTVQEVMLENTQKFLNDITRV